ncbi:transcription factor CYCLOIDEA [Ricinus communis]|uniref:Transcription factor n=1 Tax=Ricinus communis TaxID=3988 RepID=B9S5D2_RICCO|nr:transcription factor CYCLOIDEA [Ricinus communis]EEF41153.1 conserved hypothetical protein [Ricinus communis]|eukprot:XP_002521201.1 transcription factor CYCLOIDEA [Ricinus communis]
MFTSTNTVNPFMLLSSSSSSYDRSPYIIDHEVNNHYVFFNHHNPPIIPQIIDAVQNVEASNNAMISKQNCDVITGDQQQYDPSSVLLPVQKPFKKHRHSKICTAQGLRDRRVRLSIEIARKFFDLQDLLGFDKASKTLEWLLSKSRKAIKALAQNAEGAKSLSSSSATCGGGEIEGIVSKKDQSVAATGSCNEKGTKKMRIAAASTAAASNLVAKESRAKARERARERTRVKMCTRKSHESKNYTDMLNQSRSSLLNQQHHHHQQACEKLSGCNDSVKVVAHHHDHQVEELPANNSNLSSSLAKGNIIEESILIKRKLKPSTILGYQQKQSTTMGYQQNVVMFKDISCSNNLPNLPQNWDINSAIARSSFCAITNMNRPAGLHLYGKLWEAENT